MPAPATANDYATLGLNPSATLSEVELAFQELALLHHPDRSADPRAVQRFQALTQAYERIRLSGPGRLYRVGEHQPEDDEVAPVREVIPFDQPRWEEPAVESVTWRTRLRGSVIWLQMAVALATLVTTVGFWIVTAFPDQSRVEAYASSPLCSTKLTADCIGGPLSAIVDATINQGDTPIVGNYPDALRIHLGAGDTDVGVSRADSGVPYSGVQANDTVTVNTWRGDVVAVGVPNATLTTDRTPTVIQGRHRVDMWIWLVITLVMGVRPVAFLIRRRRAAAE